MPLPSPIKPRRTAPESGRKDPKRRHIDGVLPWAKILNQKPGFKYALISKSPNQWATAMAKGYEPVRREEGSEEFAGGITAEVGQMMEMQGLVLCRIPKQRWLEIEQFGENGDTGQALADEMEARIINKRSGELDPIRGLGGFVPELNTTTAIEESQEAS